MTIDKKQSKIIKIHCKLLFQPSNTTTPLLSTGAGLGGAVPHGYGLQETLGALQPPTEACGYYGPEDCVPQLLLGQVAGAGTHQQEVTLPHRQRRRGDGH